MSGIGRWVNDARDRAHRWGQQLIMLFVVLSPPLRGLLKKNQTNAFWLLNSMSVFY